MVKWIAAAGLAASGGAYALDHRLGGAVLVITVLTVFVAAVFGASDVGR